VREPRFRLPDPSPPQPGWGVVGLVAHVIVLALLAGTVGRSVVTRTANLLDSGSNARGVRQFVLPPLSQAEAVPSGVVASSASEPVDSAAGPAVVVVPRMVPIGVPAPRLKALSEYDPVVGSAPLIGMSRGTGKLWVGPVEARLGVIGTSPDVATHVARVDSAVKAIFLAYIDSMPADSFATPSMVSPWVTETEDGKTWGVDPGWIYLGDFKLPTALLALLPLPQGNIDLARGEAELLRIREQIITAARQAQTNADIKRYIKEIRERKDAERAARLAAGNRVKPDTTRPIPRR
jgi:hypothetical protein